MDNETQKKRRNRGSHLPYVLTITAVLSGLGLIVWIVQLARSGDSVGITILTALLVLLGLPVLALSLALLMWVFGRWVNRPKTEDDWQAARQSQKLMLAQLQDMQYLLLQIQKNPELAQVLAQARSNPAQLAAGSVDAAPPPALAMQPGQMMTAEGFVVDSTRFSVLDTKDEAAYEKNSDF